MLRLPNKTLGPKARFHVSGLVGEVLCNVANAVMASGDSFSEPYCSPFDYPRQAARAAMKRCAQCRGKLGLGVRARNLWNGRWWLRVRFCSTYCEALYELERYDGNADRWRTLLGRLNPQN